MANKKIWIGILLMLFLGIGVIVQAQAPRAVCNSCNGNQTVMQDVTFRCNLCDGRGETVRWERGPQCRTCRGTGNEEQNITNYNSGTPCRTCNARGTMDREVRSRCGGCNGRGETRDRIAVRCTTCNGTGTRQ